MNIECDNDDDGVNEEIDLNDIIGYIEAKVEIETAKGISDYISLADNATDEVVLAYGDLSKCIADYAFAKDQVLTMKHTIEDKKNKMIAAGTIAGKNAEERAANAWIAIPEYDDLVVLESNANTARANYEIAKTKLSGWQHRVDFYMQMIAVLAGNATDIQDDDNWLDDYDEDCIS